MALTKDQQTTVRDAAYRLGIPAAFALGIVDKESAGRAFYKVNGQNLPSIRIEGHYVYRLLKNNKPLRDKAVKMGLANPKVGGLKNPSTIAARYTLLDRIIAVVGGEIAYQSISIGIGQVMGTHYKRLGYASATQMFQAATASFDGQVMQMLSFIATDKKCLKAVQDFAYKAFALIYNGPKAKSSYWTELEEFVSFYNDGGSTVVKQPNKTALALERIKVLGFESIMQFQSARGLKVDGIVGPLTTAEIDEAEDERKKQAQAPAKSAIKVVTGAAGAGATVIAAENPDLLSSVIPIVQVIAPFGGKAVLLIAGAAIVVAVAVIAWNVWKNREK